MMAKVWRVAGVLALAAAVGLLIGWMASREGDITPIAVAPNTNPPVVVFQPAPQITESDSNFAFNARSRQSRLSAESNAAAVAPPQYATDWEQKLDNILLTDEDSNAKADQILALIPTAPPDAQVELSQHLVNMTQDDHYDGVAGLLTNAVTPVAVSTVLMNDLLNRSNPIKLPMLLDVAENDNHPLKDQAREMLELLLQQDNGTNWDQWSASINTWLQDNSGQ